MTPLRLLAPTMMLASTAAAAPILCESAEPDEFGNTVTIAVAGPSGVYSYTAYDGSLQSITLACDEFEPANYVCARGAERTAGYSGEHFFLKKTDGWWLMATSLVENAGAILSPRKHLGKARFVMMTCR